MPARKPVIPPARIKRFPVAGKRLRLPDRVAEIGEPVPEALGWRNLKAWVSSGHILMYPDDTPPPRNGDATRPGPESMLMAAEERKRIDPEPDPVVEFVEPEPEDPPKKKRGRPPKKKKG